MKRTEILTTPNVNFFSAFLSLFCTTRKINHPTSIFLMKCSPNYFCSSCVNSRLNLLKVNEITTDLPPLLETRVMKAFDTLSPNIFLDCVGFFCLQSSKCHIETNLRNKFIKTIFTIKQSKRFYFYHVINCESSSSRSYHKIWLPVCIQS